MGRLDKYFLTEPMPNSHELDAEGKTTRQNIVWMNDKVLPEATQHFMITWYEQTVMFCPGSHVHNADEYIGFVGSDPENPQELNGKVLFWMDGEWLTIEKSAIIYVPAGVPHCPYIMQDVTKPIIHFSGTPDGHYEQRMPDSTDSPAGSSSGRGDLKELISYRCSPPMPGKDTDPSILTKIVWLDPSEMPGSPYVELAWFKKPREPKPPTHTHDFDEFVGFVSSDPNDPHNLGGKIKFYLDGEWIEFTKSTVIYIPAGMEHCPFVIEEMSRPILHFSGGPGSRY